jgi:hypothetical protein
LAVPMLYTNNNGSVTLPRKTAIPAGSYPYSRWLNLTTARKEQYVLIVAWRSIATMKCTAYYREHRYY